MNRKRLAVAAGSLVAVGAIAAGGLVGFNALTAATCSASISPGQSWDSAYANASLGDTICVAAGDHGSQTILDKPGKDTAGDAADVTFQGSGVVRVALSLGPGADNPRAPDHLKFTGITGLPGSTLLVAGGDANDITIEDYSAAAFYINGAQNLTIRGTDPANCTSNFDPRPANAPGIPNSKIDRGAPALNDRITLDGLCIHNYTFGPQCIGYGGSFDCHGEGLIIFGGTNLVIRNSRFWENWTYSIFIQPAGSPFSATIEDNDFGATTDGRGGSRNTALTFGTNTLSNVLVQRNDFVAGQRLVDENGGSFTNVRAVDNKFGTPAACIPGVSYSSNTWTSGSCPGDGNPPPLTDIEAPSVPGGLATSGHSLSAFVMGWNAASDNVAVIGYGIYNGGVRVATTPATFHSFVGLTCGTSYVVGVTALDAAGNESSLGEAIASGSSTLACSPPPPPPVGLTLRKISETSTKITLGWDPVPNAVGYRFRSSTTAPKWSHTFDPTRSSVTFSKAATYRVEALGILDGDSYP